MAETSFKLPLMAGRKKLPQLPGQRAGVEYGIIWDACPIPAHGSCYVVAFATASDVSILGYIDTQGGVYRADRPITLPPEGTPDIAAVPDANGHEGTVFVKDQFATLRPRSRYHGAFRGLMREVCDDETWNSTRSLSYRVFMASMYVRLCVIGNEDAPRMAAPVVDMTSTPVAHPFNLVRDLASAPLPDALDALVFRVEHASGPSGLERYARRIIASCNIKRLRELIAEHPASLIYIERMDGFYLAFDQKGMGAKDASVFLELEVVVNRLYGVLNKLGFGMNPATASPSEEACSVLDQRVLRDVTGRVQELVDRAIAPNPWASPAQVACKPGGEWDVRTRLAASLEALNVAVRLDYDVQFSAASGELALRITVPEPASMPRELFDQAQGAWRTLDDEERVRAAEEYGARLTLVVAAAAFSAGFSVAAVTVGRRYVGEEAPYAIVRFERAEFMARLVPLAHQLQGASLMSGEAHVTLGAYRTAEEPAAALQAQAYILARNDTRELPDDLKQMLLADTAAELEVMEDGETPEMRCVSELRRQETSDPDGALNGLGELVGELEASCAAAELMSAQPLVSQFCESYIGRMLLPLAVGDSEQRIHRVPDALFFAQYELANMLFRAGALEQALTEARKVLDMASTSMQAHLLMVNILARMGEHHEVIEVVKHALRFACDREAAAYLLYRVAYSLWRVGERSAAIACYALVPRGDQMFELAQREMRALQQEAGVEGALGAEEGLTELERLGIVVPPSRGAIERLVDVAILLADNGFFYLASRCTLGLCHILGSDELGVVGRSLVPWHS